MAKNVGVADPPLGNEDPIMLKCTSLISAAEKVLCHRFPPVWKKKKTSTNVNLIT